MENYLQKPGLYSGRLVLVPTNVILVGKLTEVILRYVTSKIFIATLRYNPNMTKGHSKPEDFPAKNGNIMFNSDVGMYKIVESHLSSLLSCVVSWEVVYLLVRVNECAGTPQGLKLTLVF